MDWASSQWKEGLSTIALQKISALEEKIEKLQKERQQKQHQFDCLELTLNKEKRKVEEEKQQTVQLERQLQSLADECKNFEIKQQKFLTDIQNRDSRINNLECQLSQAKKQNSRQQQLEKDIEELRCLKESAKLENRQLEEKLIKEQNTIVKQSDAISGLEQTVKSLQEKYSNTSNSVLNVTDKENINILNISSKDNLSSESLRKKILEQENTIKSLQEELTRISGSKEKLLISLNESFSTPAKGKTTSRETSLLSAKKSSSFWDNFGSTPAKSGKPTKHINDSSSFDNESDEKVHTLQLKLKQMCQELECQRHNFEATKNVMEQRFKEKENTLKSEVKQQAQTIFDLDKELKELRNKYQQDVVQGSKKLDLVNMQLQKSELSKQQMEKDLKALEIQSNSRNSLLLQKEEELKDVLKLKNSLEASTKSLQFEKRELEKNYSTLTSQKNSLSEEIRDLKIQLDGSNNLVKEKESVISNMKKEHGSSLKIKADLENKINSLNKDLSSLQSEKSVLEKQLQELQSEISVMANNVESVTEEKKNLCRILDLEKSKSEKLKCDLDSKEKELVTLQSEIKSNELNIMSLKTELEQLISDYNVKIREMEQKLSKSDEENSHLQNEIQTLSENKKVMEENITELGKENARISDLCTSKESECESFRKKIENLESQLQSVQNDNAAKHENICLLEEKVKSIDEAYDKQLNELKDAICLLKSEKIDLEAMLKDYNINEESLKATIAKTETEKKDLSELLTSEKEKNKEIDTELSELKVTMQNLQMELNSKNADISNMNESLCSITSEKLALENDLKDLADKEKILQNNLLQIEADNQNLLDLFNKEQIKSNTLQSSVTELEKKMIDQQEEIAAKDLSINDLSTHIEELKADINESLSAITSEKMALENDLKNLADKEKTLQNNLLQIEADKQNLLDLFNIEKSKSEALQSSVTELEKKMSDQQEEIAARDLLINDLNKNIEELKANMNETICTITSEKLALEIDLKNLADKEKTLQNNLLQIEADKQNLLDLFNEEHNKLEAVQSSVIELEKKISDQREEITAKDLSINDLNKHIEEINANMNESLCAIASEKSSLENNLKNLSDKEKTLQNNLLQIEAENQNLLDLFNKEKTKSETLQSSVAELEKKISDQRDKIAEKDLSINDLNKHIRELKENMSEMNDTVSSIKSETVLLQKNLKACAVSEESLQKKLSQSEKERQKISEVLSREEEKSRLYEISVSELEKKLNNLQTELDAKDSVIYELNKNIDDFKTKTSDIEESLTAFKAEKLCLERDLKDSTDKEKSLKQIIEKLELEKQEYGDLLKEVKKESDNFQTNLEKSKEEIGNLQTELNTKDKTIDILNKTIEELKTKYCEINESMDVIKSERNSLQKNLENCLKTEEELRKSLKQVEADKQSILQLLEEGKNQTEMFQLEINKLQNQVNSMQEDFKAKDLTILDLTRSVECHKAKLSDMDEIVTTVNSEKAYLENTLKDCSLREKSLQNDLQVCESDKQNLSDQLTTEKEKSEKLHLLVTELTKNVDSQQADLILKETTIGDQNNIIEELKIKICGLTEDIDSMKSEKLTVENKLTEMTLKVESLQNNLMQIENEKAEIIEHLNAEKCKSETLELNIAEAKLQLDSFHDELDSKNMNMELINKKLKEFKYNEVHFQDLESQLTVFREREISLNEKIKQLEDEKTVTFESLSTEKDKNIALEANICDLQVKVANLESELNTSNETLSCITYDIDQSKETYELQLKEFETALEVMKSEKDNLSNQIKDFIETETALKETLKMMEAKNEDMSENLLHEIKKVEDLQINVEELKANLSTRESEICDKDKTISDLETEIENLRQTYEEEKQDLINHIGDIKYKLLSIQDSVKSIYSEQDLIERKTNNLKLECQELYNKNACAQQTREEFLSSLLNQVCVIEKHAEALEENYEEKISILKSTLWNAELKIALQAEDYAILMNEKDKLQNELLSNQAKILEKDIELKRAVISKEEHLNCLKNIEDLKNTQAHLCQENYQLQETVSDLKTQLWSAELKIALQSEDYNILMGEKTKLMEQLKSAEESILIKEMELKNVVLIKNEHLNCLEIIEDSKITHEYMHQENHQLQAQVSDLTQKLAEVESIAAEQIQKLETFKNEKSTLLEELNRAQNLLEEKGTELADVALLVKEHDNCSENIKILMEAKESLIWENHQLHEQICDLEKLLSETDSEASIQTEELNILAEEKFSLVEELKTIIDELCLKELDCQNLTSTKANLVKENTNLLVEISSVNQDLQTTKKRLSFLDSKLKDIFLKCKDVLSSLKDLGQKDNISLNCHSENMVESDVEQMDSMCGLVFQCLRLLDEYILVHSLKLEIPAQVTEIGNQYFQANDVETSNNNVLCCDENVSQFPTDSQNLQTNIAKDLSVLSTDVYTMICSFEERILNQSEKIKFLARHQLIECSHSKKLLVTLKFMKKVYNVVCCRKFALRELKDFKLCLLLQSESPQKMVSILSLFSCEFKEDADVNLFLEKFLLVNAYKNVYMAHRLKKVLYCVRDQLNVYSQNFEKHERYLCTYQNIHNHPYHMPIVTKSKYLIYLNGLSSLCFREKLNRKISCFTKNREQLFCINSILCNVKASMVPSILNCMFELKEKHLSFSVCKNLVNLMVKMLQSCCLKEVSFLSSNTVKTVHHFLDLISPGKESAFKNSVPIDQMSVLGDLVSGLLENLSSIRHLVFSDEQELLKNKTMLGEISDQLSKVKLDHDCKQRELDVLQALLQEEKDKQQNVLMSTKNDCEALLLQKEKLEKTVFEVSKLCSVLKNIFSDSCDVMNLQSEIATLCDNFCLCQTCLNAIEKSKEEQSNHVLFTPVTLIHFIAELFNSKSDLEKEVVKLEECKSVIKENIMQLENDKSLLQHTIDDLEGNVSTLEHELCNFKSKYSCLENEYQHINSLYIESNKVNEDQQNCLKQNMDDLRNCKRQYEELLTEYQKVKSNLAEKEVEISNYEKTIQNKISKHEILDIKCKNYESEIENLNIAITELKDMKEKENEENGFLVKELKNKIVSLEKSNNLLNITVETVEEELQNVYVEKQNVDKNLQEKLVEVENLQQKLAAWKNKIAEENSEVSCLRHTVQNLKKEVEDAEAKCTELLNKNSQLQNDVARLQQTIKTYEDCIIEKDSSIKENSRVINQLKEEILVITNEKENLQVNIEDTEAKFKFELQNKDTLLSDTERKLNLILKEKADLQKQISCLLISEEERKKLLLEKESSELRCRELIEEIGLLRSKLKDFELQVISGKKEKEEAFHSIQKLNLKNEKSTKKIEELENELNVVKESNIENSVLVQTLQKKLDELEACGNTQVTKENISINDSFPECACKGKAVSELTVAKPEHDYKEYMTEIISVLIAIIKDIGCRDDYHKADLISTLSKWDSNIKNPANFSEIKLKLKSVLGSQFKELKKLELELCNLKDLICKLTDELSEYCECKEQKIEYNSNMLFTKSCFEESLCVSPAKNQTYFVLDSCVGDLRSSFKTLESCFNSMKSVIIKKDLEVKSMKERGPEKVESERKTLQDETKDDYLILKSKCKLLISNAYRLEKKCKKLQQTNEELAARIKILEQEKLELNAEADEMADIIRQQNYSEELEELYKKLSESSDELQKVKEKNNCLRAVFEQYQKIFKEHGIDISAAEIIRQSAE